MALEMTLPFGKKGDVKNLVFSILVHENQLKLIQLMHFLRKRHGKEVTFQAVRKAVLQLVEEGVLTRKGHAYSINKQWVKEIKQAVDSLYEEIHAEKTQPLKIDSIQGDVSVFTFSSLNEMMKFWQNLIQNWFRGFKKGDYNINCYQAAHVWEALLHLDREKEVMGQLKKKGIHSYILCTSRSSLDRSIQQFYRKLGVKMEIIPSSSHFDRGHYLGTYGDLIIQAQYPDELVHALDGFFKRNKTINALDLTELSDFVNRKHMIRLTVIRNIEMAKQINKHTLSQMGRN